MNEYAYVSLVIRCANVPTVMTPAITKELVGEKRFRNYYRIEDSGREYLEFAMREMEIVFAGIKSLFEWEGDGDENAE